MRRRLRRRMCSGKTGSKTYVVQRDLKGQTSRVTIAAVNVMNLDDARARAEKVLADFYSGVNPKQARRSAMTLREGLAYYLSSQTSLRAKTQRDYLGVEKYLTPWLDRLLSDISSEEVEKRHREIAAAIASEGRYSGEATANITMRTFRANYNFAAEKNPSLPANPAFRFASISVASRA